MKQRPQPGTSMCICWFSLVTDEVKHACGPDGQTQTQYSHLPALPILKTSTTAPGCCWDGWWHHFCQCLEKCAEEVGLSESSWNNLANLGAFTGTDWRAGIGFDHKTSISSFAFGNPTSYLSTAWRSWWGQRHGHGIIPPRAPTCACAAFEDGNKCEWDFLWAFLSLPSAPCLSPQAQAATDDPCATFSSNWGHGKGWNWRRFYIWNEYKQLIWASCQFWELWRKPTFWSASC